MPKVSRELTDKQWKSYFRKKYDKLPTAGELNQLRKNHSATFYDDILPTDPQFYEDHPWMPKPKPWEHRF